MSGPATAASAAFCTAGTSGVWTGVPGTGATDAISCPWSVVFLSVLTTVTVNPGRAGQLLLERPLQPGEAQLVAVGVPGRSVVLAVLDDLRGRRADPPEQGEGEAGRRGQQPGGGGEDRAGQVEDLRADLLEVGPPEGDHRDELAGPGLLDVGDDLVGGDAGGRRERRRPARAGR